jgi:hypothetical protein
MNPFTDILSKRAPVLWSAAPARIVRAQALNRRLIWG